MAIIRGRVKKPVGNPNFVKGYTGATGGRPKGRYSDITLSFMKLKKIASTRAEEAFGMLWSAMERGESWAYQIYFKELYTLPRNIDEKTVTITDKDTSLDGQIGVLTSILPEFDEVTHDESLSRLKVLTAVKGNDVMVKQNDEIRETRETLLEKVELIQQIRDLKEKV
jgi:hypothetical protein